MTVMRISDTGIKLKGTLALGQPTIRLDASGNLQASEVYNQLIAYENTEDVDDTHKLEDTTSFNDTDTVESFLLFFFGITENQVLPNKVYFSGAKIVANNITENQNIGGGV